MMTDDGNDDGDGDGYGDGGDGDGDSDVGNDDKRRRQSHTKLTTGHATDSQLIMMIIMKMIMMMILTMRMTLCVDCLPLRLSTVHCPLSDCRTVHLSACLSVCRCSFITSNSQRHLHLDLGLDQAIYKFSVCGLFALLFATLLGAGQLERRADGPTDGRIKTQTSSQQQEKK